MAVFSILLTTLLTYTTVLSQVLPGALNPALGGLPGALPGAGIGSLLDGTYTWIGIDGGTYTLNVCSGLGFDRSLYAGIERAALNNFGLPQNSLFFFNIIGRSNGPRLGVDGAVATFQGIRLGDTFGFRNIIFTLLFSRCDNAFQLIMNDEAYTLIKTSNIVLNQNSCWLPGQQSFLGLPNVAQFSAQLPILNGFNRIMTLNRNNNNIFGCFGNQNIQTNAFTGGLGTLFGNRGLGGQLLWNNRLLISPFQDQLNPLCPRGIEMLLLRPRGQLFCNRRCLNMPALGFSGAFNRLPSLVNGFNPQSCVFPNLNTITGFPGFVPQGPILPQVGLGAGLGVGGVGLGAGAVGLGAGVGVGLGGVGTVGVGGVGLGGVGVGVAAPVGGTGLTPVTAVNTGLGTAVVTPPVSGVVAVQNPLTGAVSSVSQRGTATIVRTPATGVIPGQVGVRFP